MSDTTIPADLWRKSSYSGGGNDCVEVAITSVGAAIRDSKNPEGGALVLSERSWLLLRDALCTEGDGPN